MFIALALKWYVTSNTHNPRWKSFHLEIWDISRLFTHFSLVFPALGSESHIFCLLGAGKSGEDTAKCPGTLSSIYETLQI